MPRDKAQAAVAILIMAAMMLGSTSAEGNREVMDQLAEHQENEPDDSIDLTPKLRSKGKFTCVSCQPPDCHSETVCHKAWRCYTAHVRNTNGTLEKSKGCTRNHQQTMLHCGTFRYDGSGFHKLNAVSAQLAFDCCKGSMCNEKTPFPPLPDVPKFEDIEENGLSTTNNQNNSELSHANIVLIVVVSLTILLLVLAVALIICCMRRNHEKKMKKLNTIHFEAGNDHELMGLNVQRVGDSTLREYKGGDVEDSCMTSGSGSGALRMVQRSLARNIQLLEPPIGKGRYGEVYKGIYAADYVAVKIFFSRDEESFKRETRIYELDQMRHEHILGYYGSDTTSRNSCTQNWLVTHYHPMGSLYDYLNRPESLSTRETFKLLYTAVSGLVHLHTQIVGTKEKPPIAHRDIKSKNILVKLDGTCVVADFGLAVMPEDQDNLASDEYARRPVGTHRYMSPEVLDKRVDPSVVGYQKSDIYSFALVMWEVVRRTRTTDQDPGTAEDFALAYFDKVTSDPSMEEMKKVVCSGMRPEFPSRLWTNRLTAGICNLIKESWREKANARLTSLRLKINLKALEASTLEEDPDYPTNPLA